MNAVFRWLQRESVPEAHRELFAKIHELQETLDARTKENEEHIAKLRAERDEVERQLRDVSDWFDAVSKAFEQDIPSVTQQTPWRCAMFNFGKAQKMGITYFNPGLVER